MLLISIWDIYWMGFSSFFLGGGLPTSMANGFVRSYLNMGVCPQKLQSWFLNVWFRTMESFGVPVLVSRTIRGGSDQGWCANLPKLPLARKSLLSITQFLRQRTQTHWFCHIFTGEISMNPHFYRQTEPKPGWLNCKFHAAGRTNGLPRHANTLHSDQGVVPGPNLIKTVLEIFMYTRLYW